MYRFYFFAFLLLNASVSWAIENHWAKAAEISGVPEQKIYAISLQESGLKMKDGKIRPWPWTLNSAKGAMRFNTKEEAYRAIQQLVREGITSIDIGLMQINMRVHWKDIQDKDILEPSINIMVAANILKGYMAETKGNVRKATAYYHSHNHERASNYETSVRKYESWIASSLADSGHKNTKH